MFGMTSFLNDDLQKNLQLFQFPAYTNIYIEEAEQNFLFFLVEGQVQCTHYHMNGKLAVVALLNPFTVIGDLEILREEGMNSNVITSQVTTMLGIGRALVHRYGKDDPRFLRFLVNQLQEKLHASKPGLICYKPLGAVHFGTTSSAGREYGYASRKKKSCLLTGDNAASSESSH